MSCLRSASIACSAVWRRAGAATTRRNVATSAALLRRFPRYKLPLNTERLPRSEQMQVQVVDTPDASRGVPLPDGGIQYYGFKYYPRFPGQADPPVTPAKLHRVQLISSLYGQTQQVKYICKLLGVHDPECKYNRHRRLAAVVKNIPEVNAMLYKVKHLVRIDPVTFPDGEPSMDDLDGWHLLEDGRVVRDANYCIEPVTTEYDRLKMPDQTVRKRLELRWIKPFDLDEKRTV